MVKRFVAAVGNFDGVHRGHQQLLGAMSEFAAGQGAAPAAVVFEPHPRRYFQPDAAPFLLTAPEQRRSLLFANGAEKVFALTFDAALAATSPERFVFEVLKERLGLAGVVVGSEFRFGKGRSGDAEGLKSFCAEAGLIVKILDPKMEGPGGEKIGSSAIRAAIAEGDVSSAARMLGRLWSVDGEVESGQKLGRTIGFPTANFRLGELIEPKRGVYAVKATVRGQAHLGVANFGRRPTIGASAPLLETHLFNFSGDLYGRRLEVALVDFIREERKFESLDALKAQIASDCGAARSILTASR